MNEQQMRVPGCLTAAVVLALGAGSADAQTVPWTADDLIKSTSIGDASKCYYGLWTGKACASGSSGGVYLIDKSWYVRACVHACVFVRACIFSAPPCWSSITLQMRHNNITFILIHFKTRII